MNRPVEANIYTETTISFQCPYCQEYIEQEWGEDEEEEECGKCGKTVKINPYE